MPVEQPATLQTDRLDLRALSIDDADQVYRIHSHPDAMRFMDTPPHRSAAETRSHLTGMLAGDACFWAIRQQGDETIIGYVGYLANTNIPGMGYMLHPDSWGRGYGTEAVRAALAYGFTTLNLDRVELWIDDRNLGSRKLAAKAGFTYRGRFRMRYAHDVEPHEKLVYGLYRYEWRAAELAPVKPIPAYRVQPVLSVTDVEETADYYCRQLEFTLDFLYGEPPVHGAVTMSEWSTEGVTIQLSQAEPPSQPAGMVLYIFTGPDIDARYQRYVDRNVTVIQPLQSLPWGMREFQIADNSGYVLRFGTPASNDA